VASFVGLGAKAPPVDASSTDLALPSLANANALPLSRR
jgi:hypothetical protein